MKTTLIIFVILLVIGCASNRTAQVQKTIINTTPENIHTKLELDFEQGKSHNHPSFAVWIEDLDGNFIETLYVTQYVAIGIFGHGEIQSGRWSDEPGEARRPASLPYWSHKRNIKAPDGLYIPSPETAVPDALTGATPIGSFILDTGTKITSNDKFKILAEVNQPWDSNNYWSNSRFPDDKDYNTSLQPAIVYSATVDPMSNQKEYNLKAIGHSDPSGKNGELTSDLSTLTTAMEIFQNIVVRIK